jgi:hypothetical protein
VLALPRGNRSHCSAFYAPRGGRAARLSRRRGRGAISKSRAKERKNGTEFAALSPEAQLPVARGRRELAVPEMHHIATQWHQRGWGQAAPGNHPGWRSARSGLDLPPDGGSLDLSLVVALELADPRLSTRKCCVASGSKVGQSPRVGHLFSTF